jgi:uncharacterized membrane protein YagU involved in acid resistance
MKTKFNISSAILAGFIGTILMTAFTYMAPLMGFKMDIPAMLSKTMHSPIIIGLIAHFMVGEILAIIYALLFLGYTKQNPSAKNGAIYGILPWLVAQLFVMPTMMMLNGGSFVSGLFSGSVMMAMASLVGHFIYGATLGIIYKPKKDIEVLNH